MDAENAEEARVASVNKPLFPADWPRALVLAHLVFWAASAALLGGPGLSLTTALVSAGMGFSIFLFFLFAVLLLGCAALRYGRIYANIEQAVGRAPLSGWRARARGAYMIALSGSAGVLLGLISQVKGV